MYCPNTNHETPWFRRHNTARKSNEKSFVSWLRGSFPYYILCDSSKPQKSHRSSRVFGRQGVSSTLSALWIAGISGITLAALPATAQEIPVPASWFGFNTLAFKTDFTQRQLTTNWLGGCPNGAGNYWPIGPYLDDWGHDWWLNNTFDWYHNKCNTAYQATDPVYGNLALALDWVVNSADTTGVTMQSASLDYHGDYGTATQFPNNIYIKITARMLNPAPSALMVLHTWTADGLYDQSKAGIEADVVEYDTGTPNASDTIVHNQATNQTSPWIMAPWSQSWNQIDPSQYNSFGMVVFNNQYVCSYINDVWQDQCQTVPFYSLNANQRYILIVKNTCDWYNHNGGCEGRDGQLQELLIKSIEVYSCDSWQTTQCNIPIPE